MAGNTIAVSIVSDVSKMRKGIDDVNGRLGRFESSASKAGRVARNLVGGIAVVAGVKALTGALGDCVEEARESQKVNRLTANLIKQTGGAANVTAKQVGKLATSISNKSGVDDEAIQSGANLLLTFKNVRNEVGKGNKIFDRATQAATDLSSIKGFGGMEGASKQLGKALNDPVKGISALSKAGVTFTDGQKANIKSLVSQNRTLDAQKIILKEVESQVGGSAAAQATAGEKAKVAYDNLKESIGTALLPVLDRFFTFASNKLIPAISKIPQIFRDVRTFLEPVIGYFRSFSTEGGNAGSKMDQLRSTVQTAWTQIQSIFQSGVSIVSSLWRMFGGTITSFLSGTVSNILLQLRGLFNIVSGIFKVFSALLKGDWRGVWEGVKQILRGAVQVVTAVVRQLWNTVKSLFRIGGTAIRAVFVGAWNAIRSAAVTGISNLIGKVKGIPGKIKSGLGNVKDMLLNAGRSIINGLIRGITEKLNDLYDKVKGIGSKIKSLKGPLSYDKVMLRPEGQAIIQGLIDGIASQERKLYSKVGAISRNLAGTTFALGPVAAPAGGNLALGGLSTAGRTQVTNTYNVAVQFDNSMSEVEMGVQYTKAIRAAKKVGAIA